MRQAMTRKENYRPIFLMNIDAKILANWVSINRVIHSDQVVFPPGIPKWFNIWKINMRCHINKTKEKSYDHLNSCIKKESDTIQDSSMIKKTLSKVSIEGIHSQQIKVIKYLTKPRISLNNRVWKAFPLRSEVKMLTLYHFDSTQLEVLAQQKKK